MKKNNKMNRTNKIKKAKNSSRSKKVIKGTAAAMLGVTAFSTVAPVVKASAATTDDAKVTPYSTEEGDVHLSELKASKAQEIKDMKFLIQDKKDSYLNQIDAAESPQDVYKISDRAYSEDKIAGAGEPNGYTFEQAKDSINSNLGSTEKIDYMGQIDAKLKAKIQALPNLSDSEKAEFIDQMVSGNYDDILANVTNASNKAGSSQELDDGKAKAKDEINNSLPNLSGQDKTDFIDRIDKAMAVDEVNDTVNNAETKNAGKSTTPEDVQTVVDQTHAKATAMTANTKTDSLNEVINEAHDTINALPNLSDYT